MANPLGRSILAAALSYISLFYFSFVEACPSLNLTLERCTSSTDCANVFESSCRGFTPNNELLECPNGDVDLCLCIPFDYHFCQSNSDCIDQEYCGVSAVTGNKLCVGCLTRSDTTINFSPVDERGTQERCAASTEAHPPCGQMGDFCSPSMPCSPSYNCLSLSTSSPVECRWQDVPCRCSAGDHPTLQSCTSNFDCLEAREACAWNPFTNRYTCMSCDIIRDSHFLMLNDKSRCQNLSTKRSQPVHYIEGSNGRTYDICEQDIQCTDGRRCMQSKARTDFSAFVSCSSSSEDFCYCKADSLVKCESGTDCQQGESCVDSSDFNLQKNCVSNAFLDATSAEKYTLVGERTTSGSGTGVNDSPCRFDWDCAGSRRCTHVQDTFGGCAGRAACSCKNLVSAPCNRHIHCEDGELCSKVVDAQTRTRCISKKIVDKYDYIRSYNDPEILPMSPTPIPEGLSAGLTEDPCISSSDCVSPRRCLHRTESDGIVCDNDRRYCRCLPPSPDDGTRCSTSSDCALGEICSTVKDSIDGGNRCVSSLAFDAELFETRTAIGLRQPPSANSPLPATSIPSSSDNQGSSGEEQNSISSFTPPTSPLISSTIEPFRSTPPISSDVGRPSDSSSEIDSTGEPSLEPAPCIDAKLLSHFDGSQLVFRNHRRASVLCDLQESCATPGHMVSFNGYPMSMKSYCNIHVRCKRKIAWVNSPRMGRGLRVASRTDGLSMTAYAARYGFWLEEAVLRQVIQLGL